MAKKSYPPSVIEWTHISDDTPDNADEVLVIHRGYVGVAAVWEGRFSDYRERKISPTHWANLPSV